MPLLPRSSLRQHRPRGSLVEEAAATAVSYLTSPHLNAEERPLLLTCLASRKEVGLPVLGEGRRVPVWRWPDRRCRWRGRTGKGADQTDGA
jgi:hypothetical protein